MKFLCLYNENGEKVHCSIGLSTAKQVTFEDPLFMHAFKNSKIVFTQFVKELKYFSEHDCVLEQELSILGHCIV